MRHYYIYIIGIILCLTSCTQHSKHWETLKQVDSFIEERPDSALTVLRGMDKKALSGKEEEAKHALLLSMALDKNYIDKTNDSLINIAVDYYKDRDDVRAKFLSYYYQGRIYTNANNLTQATLAYLEAEQLVDALGDDYYAGLLYQYHLQAKK